MSGLETKDGAQYRGANPSFESRIRIMEGQELGAVILIHLGNST